MWEAFHRRKSRANEGYAHLFCWQFAHVEGTTKAFTYDVLFFCSGCCTLEEGRDTVSARHSSAKSAT